MEKARFATAINCIDGRAQGPVAEWLKKNVRADYVDTITEPGVDKALLDREESVKRKVSISINAHNSNAVAIAGHHDCAGNPVSKEEHVEHIKKCVEIAVSWGFPVRILGLWVNNNWHVEVVTDTQP